MHDSVTTNYSVAEFVNGYSFPERQAKYKMQFLQQPVTAEAHAGTIQVFIHLHLTISSIYVQLNYRSV